MKEAVALSPLSEKNEKAYERYVQAQALGALPEEAADELFRENCAVIYETERMCRGILLHWLVWGKPKPKAEENDG